MSKKRSQQPFDLSTFAFPEVAPKQCQNGIKTKRDIYTNQGVPNQNKQTRTDFQKYQFLDDTPSNLLVILVEPAWVLTCVFFDA